MDAQQRDKPDANTPVRAVESRERRLILLLCVLGALHVFIYSAAFPFFNNVDEEFHFDLVVRYANGNPPRGPGHFSSEALPYIVYFGTFEYHFAPTAFPDGQYPLPPWKLPKEEAGTLLDANKAAAEKVENHEASQPPLYYVIAGLGWRMGRMLNLTEGTLLYGVRFLNVIFIVTLVWMGYFTARLLFPDRTMVRLGVPALLAFIPQSVFYSVQNDVLSPICFGLVFLSLLRWLCDGALTVRLAAVLGLALAATFLTKLSNLPLIAFAVFVIVFLSCRLACAGKLKVILPALAVLVLCAGLPALAWLVWIREHFGDLTGSQQKIKALGWTFKPFNEWWSHPIFTLRGLWTFVSGNLATLWQGEMIWHDQPLIKPALNMAYSVLSLVLLGCGLAGLLLRRSARTNLQRHGIWLSFGCLAALLVFLGWLSIRYNFHNCVYPSLEHPYFISGRLLLGALIPFLLLFAYGLDCALSCIKIRWVRPAVLSGLILFMLISELATNWPVFSSQFNWYHM